MIDNTSSQQIFLNAQIGIKNIYQLLYNKDISGVTKDNISNPSNIGINDIPFLQILSENFDKADTDNNKILSKEEILKMTSSLSKDGLTLEQLSAISTQLSDSEKEKIEKIIANFKKVDKNGDGLLTSDEIKDYNLNKEIEDKKTTFKEVKASDFSTFYVDNTLTTDDDESETL